jgi:long-chain acyl-CoA synthetase
MGLSYLLRRAVQIRPDHTALIFQDRRQTWAAFHQRVIRLGGGLKSLGVGPDDRVAAIMDNSDRYTETLIATPWIGGVIVGLNVRWSIGELRDALREAAPKVLLLDDGNLAVGRVLAAELGIPVVFAGDGPCPEGPWPNGMAEYEALIAGSDPAEDVGRTGRDLFTINYTGGTTGRSKGVMLCHANSVSCALSGIADGLFTESAVYLTAMPMFHTGGIWPWVSCMTSGATTVLLPGFDAENVLRAIETHRVTESLLVPTMIQRLIEHPRLGDYDISSFTQILYGASPITESLLDRALAALPQAKFVQCYGMTELSPLAATLPHENLLGEHRKTGRYRAAGRAIPAVEIDIRDEDDNPVPRRTVGQILMRGPNLMLGYWNWPEETEKALKGGWMHTGDGGYMDEDGFIYVVDRVKDMIISGGENVFSVEVENIIALHPAVQSCAVIGIPHEEWIETVHAIVVPHAGQTADAAEIIAHCRARIAHYKCPRSVEFRAEPLPLSAAGKVLKRELRAEFLSRSAN